MNRKPYPSDVSDDEWAFVAPYLLLMSADAPQRKHDLRKLFNGLRYLVRAGVPWRMLPHDLPPWEAVYQQTQRWIRWGCFEGIVHDLRELCVKWPDAQSNRRRQFSMAAPGGSPAWRVDKERAMTDTKKKRGSWVVKFTWRWTRWGIFLLFW